MPNALSRKKDYRNNVLRNLATSLILYEQIKTTKAKAKTLKPVVEHLIATAKKNDLAARRMLLAYLFDENATKKMIEVLVPRYKKINSGFIKTYKLGARLGDNAQMVMLQLIPGEVITPIVSEKKVTSKEDKNASKESKSLDKGQGKPAKSVKADTKASRKTTK